MVDFEIIAVSFRMMVSLFFYYIKWMLSKIKNIIKKNVNNVCIYSS